MICFITALTSYLEKFLLAPEIEWIHCFNLTVSLSHSEPQNHGIPGILLGKVVPDAPSPAEPLA